MRARLLLAVLGFAGTAMLAPPPASVGQVPLRDAAVGSGAGGFGFGEVGFEFNVSSGPAGEAPSGSASFSSPLLGSGTFTGISCLAVDGDTATFAGPLELSDPLGGDFGKMIVTDNAGDVLPVDRVGVAVYRTPPTCSPDFIGAEPFARPDLALTSGDIAVVDAPSLPTSTRQCKHGGWRSYGVFKNQGDCVSFVATGPRLRLRVALTPY